MTTSSFLHLPASAPSADQSSPCGPLRTAVRRSPQHPWSPLRPIGNLLGSLIAFMFLSSSDLSGQSSIIGVEDCWPGTVDTVGWVDTWIRDAAVQLKIPSGAEGALLTVRGLEDWTVDDARLLVTVGDSSGPSPLTMHFGPTFVGRPWGAPCSLSSPLGSWRVRRFIDDIGQTSGRFVATAALKIAGGPWLLAAIEGRTVDAQNRFFVSLRSARVPAESQSPPPSCPHASAPRKEWKSVQIQSPRLSFMAPPGLTRTDSPGGSPNVFVIDSTTLDFVRVASPRWNLSTLKRGAFRSCSILVGGHAGELVAAAEVPELPKMTTMLAFVNIDSLTSLAIWGHANSRASVDTFAAIVFTVRVGP
jgi:hypothetical protein